MYCPAQVTYDIHIHVRKVERMERFNAIHSGSLLSHGSVAHDAADFLCDYIHYLFGRITVLPHFCGLISNALKCSLLIRHLLLRTYLKLVIAVVEELIVLPNILKFRPLANLDAGSVKVVDFRTANAKQER